MPSYMTIRGGTIGVAASSVIAAGHIMVCQVSDIYRSELASRPSKLGRSVVSSRDPLKRFELN